MSDPIRTDAIATLVESLSPLIVRIDGDGRAHRATGVRWLDDGLILTTASAIGRRAEVIVGDATGKESAAEVVGRDPGTDLALLRVPDRDPLQSPAQTDAEMKVGRFVVAFARPGRSIRAAFSIIGAVGGEFHTMAGGRIDAWIELDRPLSYDFSGGPVVDLEGGVIGMASFALSRGGIVVPVSTIDRVVSHLLHHGEVSQGYIGVAVHPVRLLTEPDASQPNAVVVVGIEPGGPAHEAGLLVGDVLLGIDGSPISTPLALRAALADKAAQRVQLHLLRGGRDVHVEIEPSSRN